jgi:hypothetical protein
MPSTVWWPLLMEHRFAVSWGRLHHLLGVTLTTPFSDTMALLQQVFHRRRIQEAAIEQPLVFIVGHWRSGTTLLHELMVLDDHFAYPNTYQCFAPWHFLLTEGAMKRFGNGLIPSSRPMDNMSSGWSLPQEDEFALLNLGLPSFYRRLAFPRSTGQRIEALDIESLPEPHRQNWIDGFRWFLQALSYHHQKPLVLKSPTHTARVRLLMQLFPEARFVHICRHPEKLFPSTVRLWRVLEQVQALQPPSQKESIEQLVLDCLPILYQNFDRDRALLSDHRWMEVKYERLVERPVETLRGVYQQLELGWSDRMEERVNRYMADKSDYSANVFHQDPANQNRVQSAWREYGVRHGYYT